MRADRGSVALFVVRLGKLCAVPAGLTEADVLSRVGEYAALLCGEMECGAFTDASFAYVAARCRFFPAYAELLDHLRAWWRENRPALPALPAPREPDREEPTNEQRDAVSRAVQTATAILAESIAEKQAAAGGGKPAAIRANHLPDVLLLAEYRKVAAGDGKFAGAAAERVRMLERKLAGLPASPVAERAATLDDVVRDRAAALAGEWP